MRFVVLNYTCVQTESCGQVGFVSGAFNLATPLLETEVNGNKETLQLIELGTAGEIKIR